MTAFPVFKDIQNTLKNWSVKLSQLAEEVEVDIFAINQEVATSKYFTDENGVRKQVFRKGIFIPSLPNATSANYDHNIEYSQIFRIWGILKNNAGIFIPFPYPYPGANDDGCFINGSVLTIQTSTNRTTYSGYIFVEYLK